MPQFVSIIRYKKEEWDLLMSQFADAKNMQDSWAQWRHAAELGVERMTRSGHLVIPIELSSEEILLHCQKTGEPNIGRTRTNLASIKMMELMKEKML
jgi:hypothetical protein